MEEKLNDYQKSVLSNGETLRAKLLIYLQKPEAVEYYAKTAEKCFLQGNKEKFQKISDLSWWGFFYGWIFLLYRKSEEAGKWFGISLILGIIYFIMSKSISSDSIAPIAIMGIIFLVGIWVWIHLAKYSKFYIIQTFMKVLRESNGDDSILASKGGTSTLGFVLGILATPIVILETIGLAIIPVGIIAAVLTPRLAGTRSDAEVAQAVANIRTLTSDFSAYYVLKGEFPKNIKEATNVKLEQSGEVYYIKVGGENCIKFDYGYLDNKPLIKFEVIDTPSELCKTVVSNKQISSYIREPINDEQISSYMSKP